MHGGIGQHELHGETGRRHRAGAFEHRRRDIDPEHAATRRDLRRQRDGQAAAAAADIENAVARSGRDTVDQDLRDRREQHVLRRLPVRPALAAGTVPVCDLVGVSVIP